MDSNSHSNNRWDYIDFSLEIREGSGRNKYIIAIRSPEGEAEEEVRFPFDEWELQDKLRDVEVALLRSYGSRRRIGTPEEETVREFGRALFEAVFVGNVDNHYRANLRESKRQNKGLRLRLHVRPPELSALPWEFIYDPKGNYLALSPRTPLVRYPNVPQPIERLTVMPPLSILGIVASPQGLPELDVRHEKRLVEEAVKELREEGLVELTWLSGQTWHDLRRAMRRDSWHVFHFIGHGGFDPETEEGAIALSDEEGRQHLLGAGDLALLLDDHYPLRLVFLNSCEGARGSPRDSFSSTAATLVRSGIPAVVAMQYEITDKAAIDFSRTFYEAVADGLPMDAAVTEARTAIKVKSALEWGTPVLYMRSKDGRIFDFAKDPARGYREDIERVWEAGELTRREAQWLSGRAQNYGLSARAVADAERRIMGDTKEAIIERQDRLAELYAQARQSHRDRDWQAVVAIFDQIQALEPAYSDPERLLVSAHEALADLQEPPPPPPPPPPLPRSPWVKRAMIAILAAFVVVGLIVAITSLTRPTVPNLVGKTESEAVRSVGEDYELDVSGVRISDEPAGVILSQDPKPGSEAPRGKKIFVAVSAGSDMVQVPEVVGRSRGEAENALRSKGFEVTVKIRESSEDDAGKVVGQSPSGGETQKGSEVALTVGQAPKPAPGYTLVEDASGRLTVEVPSEWETQISENVTLRVLNSEGIQIEEEKASAVINAAPDLGNWQEVYPANSNAGAGTSLMVVEELAQEYTNDQLIDSIPALSFAEHCSLSARNDLDRASYSGRVQWWNPCNTPVPTYITLAAAPKSRECALVGQIGVISEADREAAQRILDTFEVDCGNTARVGPRNPDIAGGTRAGERNPPG